MISSDRTAAQKACEAAYSAVSAIEDPVAKLEGLMIVFGVVIDSMLDNKKTEIEGAGLSALQGAMYSCIAEINATWNKAFDLTVALREGARNAEGTSHD